ncbi:MAG: hypothetical protein QM784_17475 [Polyangiaceae bacterium]
MRTVKTVAWAISLSAACATGCIGGGDALPGDDTGHHRGGASMGGAGTGGATTDGGSTSSGGSAATGGRSSRELSLLERFGIATDSPVGLVGRAVLPAATFVEGPASGALIGSYFSFAARSGLLLFG